MAPRKTRTGASATTRRSPAKGRARASSTSRSKGTRAAPSGSTRATTARKPAKKKADPGRWWVLPVTAVAVLVVFAWTYYPVARVQYRETREKARLSAELTSLKARNDRLRKQVERLKTPEGVEDYARSQLGLVKKGEHVVVVVDGDEAAEASAALAAPRIDSARTADQPAGPWTAFLDLVFGVQ